MNQYNTNTIRKRTLQDLTIRDNFMFAAVMMQGDNCKCLLEIILGIEIERVEVSYEKSIVYNPECKGVRLDVYAKNADNTRYDVEMQVAGADLGKRIRYYHSQMDMELLLSGEPYEELPTSYVIFVCNFDPFDQGKYCYTFENHCMEVDGLTLGNGCRSILLNAKGINVEEVSPQLAAFLEFIREDTPTNDTEAADEFVKKLQNTVRKVKRDRELGQRYMFLEDLLRQERKQAKIEGKIEYILEVLEEYGDIPESVRSRIMSETDLPP